MTRLLKFSATLFAVALLAGCATSGPRFEAEKAVPPDHALVYVYREAGFVGGGLAYMVRANGAEISTLPAGGYFVYHAPPGEVEFSAQTEAKTSVTIDAKAGQTYYIKGTVGVGVFIGHPHLVVVSGDVGAKEIAACNLVPGAKSASGAAIAGQSTTSSQSNNVVIAIAPADVVEWRPGPTDVQLAVADRRTRIVMERTTIGHLSMGGVVLQPSETELIKSIITAKLNKEIAAHPRSPDAPPISCELTEFSITTPATVLYWDVTTDIAVTLRSGDQQRSLKAHAVKRTYAWPSESLIKTTTIEALKVIATASGPALSELITPAPAR